MKKNSPSSAKKIKRNPRNKTSSEILFIILLALGLVYLFALLSYSHNENPWSGDVALVAPVANWAGIFGAYLSDISLSILGYSAYIIPMGLIGLGWRIHKNIQQERLSNQVILSKTLAFLVLIAFSSAFLAQSLPNVGASGGFVGVSMHDYFGVIFGSVSLIVYLAIMMLSYSIVASASWSSIFAKLGHYLQSLVQKIQASRAQAKLKKTQKPTIAAPKTASTKAKAMTKVKQVSEKP